MTYHPRYRIVFRNTSTPARSTPPLKASPFCLLPLPTPLQQATNGCNAFKLPFILSLWCGAVMYRCVCKVFFCAYFVFHFTTKWLPRYPVLALHLTLHTVLPCTSAARPELQIVNCGKAGKWPLPGRIKCKHKPGVCVIRLGVVLLTADDASWGVGASTVLAAAKRCHQTHTTPNGFS